MAALTSKLPKQPLTSHPSVKSKLETGTFLTFALRYISETTTVHVSEYDYREDPVVVSGNLITSRGPGAFFSLHYQFYGNQQRAWTGTAFPFALTLVEHLCGATKREEVQGPMVFPPGTPW